MLSSGTNAFAHASNMARVIPNPARLPFAMTTRPLLERRKLYRERPYLDGRFNNFHTSSRKTILPPLPQRIDGTTNDPAPIPKPSPSHGSYHWGFERAVSVALVPLAVAPFAAGSLNPVMDAVFCGAVLVHSHIGFQSVIIDYLPKKRVPKSKFLFWWGLNAGTILVAVGLYEFETNDVGVTEAIKRIWLA